MTSIPWFRYGAREVKRHIRRLKQRGAKAWVIAYWTDCLQRERRIRRNELKRDSRMFHEAD